MVCKHVTNKRDMEMLKENRDWRTLSTEEWQLLLPFLKEQLPGVRMIPNILTYLEDKGWTPRDKQAQTLQRLWMTSRARVLWEKKAEQQDTLDLSLQMTKKFMSQSQSKHVNHVPAEIIRYNEGSEIERKPIGFKQKSTLQKPHNRYTMDTSIENIRQTKLERFDALFND